MISKRDKKLVELDQLLRRPRNDRVITFGKNLAKIEKRNLYRDKGKTSNVLNEHKMNIVKDYLSTRFNIRKMSGKRHIKHIKRLGENSHKFINTWLPHDNLKHHKIKKEPMGIK